MNDRTVSLIVKSGHDGGAAPEVGMPIEDPTTHEDLIISEVRPSMTGALRIDTYWPGDPVEEALPVYSDEWLIICRPAVAGEVEAWHRSRIRDERSYAEAMRQGSWWRRVFG